MKNMVKSMLVIISVALFSFVAQAGHKKVLIVSDIDDTIKVSHVLSLSAKFARALNITTPFTGMSQLYQLIINQNYNSTDIVYLSNAPKDIKGIELMRISHEKFLQLNRFPPGELILRADLKDQNHKLNSIRKLISEQNPDLLIMIGDNGELDSLVYAQIATDLAQSGTESLTYIHQLYSSKNWIFEVGKELESGQIGFVTPFEIALDLKNRNMFDQASIDWMAQNIMPYIINEKNDSKDILGPMTFPSFKDCSDYHLSVSFPTQLVPLAKKIENRCR